VSGSITPKTTGYLIYGKVVERYAMLNSGGHFVYYGDTPTVFPSMTDALKAVADAGKHSTSSGLGPLEIHKQVEYTVTETKTERMPLE
jgi:hypothetical protein